MPNKLSTENIYIDNKHLIKSKIFVTIYIINIWRTII